MSILTDSILKEQVRGIKFQLSDVKLQKYTGESIKVLGEYSVLVQNGKQDTGWDS